MMMQEIISIVLLGITLQGGDPKEEEVKKETTGPLYNMRYCEILLADFKGVKLEVDVYSTMRCNTCSQETWDAIDLDKLADSNDVFKAIANGPRYMLMDRATKLGGESLEFCAANLAGLEMTKVASLSMPLRRKKAYERVEVKRSTVFHFEAGRTVQILKSSEGDCYIMQSYSQIVDKDLGLDDLETLGDRLDLPKGWSYQSIKISDDLDVATTDGLAVVVQDELKNTYQKMDKNCF